MSVLNVIVGVLAGNILILVLVVMVVPIAVVELVRWAYSKLKGGA